VQNEIRSLAGVAVMAVSCFCQETGLLGRIKENYSGNEPLSASFDLHIAWKIREKEETKHGSIVLAPRDRFRIELGSGLWVSDGTTLWQYDKTIGQAVIKSLSSLDNSMLPSHAITKYCSEYPLAPKAGSGANEVLEWKADTQAAKAAEVVYVSITADKKTGAVRRLVVVDKNGNESAYAFGHVVFGRAAPPQTFIFEVPKGARVLDQR
jgi:outer membrane lipoprotein-sorting protein